MYLCCLCVQFWLGDRDLCLLTIGYHETLMTFLWVLYAWLFSVPTKRFPQKRWTLSFCRLVQILHNLWRRSASTVKTTTCSELCHFEQIKPEHDSNDYSICHVVRSWSSVIVLFILLGRDSHKRTRVSVCVCVRVTQSHTPDITMLWLVAWNHST